LTTPPRAAHGDAMDEKQERARTKRLRNRDKQRKLRVDGAVRALLQHVEGREYLYWLMEIGHIGRNPFASNALISAFNCGELNVGQQIQSHVIEVSAEGYLQMLREKQEEQEDDGPTSDDDPDN